MLQRYRINNCSDIAEDGGGYCLSEDVSELEKSKWISVVDNPPKKEEEYLIWPHGKYCGPTAMFWPFADHGGHVKNTFEIESEYGDITQIDVTHYQELPGGPK